MLWYGLLVLCSVTISTQNESDDWKLLQTAQGPVRGRKDPEGMYVFYNIPYATAPTGENKFKAPLPPPNWTEPFEAIDKGVICPQALVPLLHVETNTMQEDCLRANVYVPDTDEKNLSVMVYIHGGAFQIGFGKFITVKNLMKTKKLIVVNFNYRLGIHGFLCLGTKDVPGNAGMKDMVAMLRWVNKNIVSFGGNPNDVTIVGSSAGAAAADLLILSKSSKGLFHKVIIESASNLAEFTVQLDPLANAKMHAKTLNFTNVDDINSLEMFYKSASYDILTLDAFLERKDSTFVFVPCIERDSESTDEVFLVDSPINILKKGAYEKVPMLYGFANMEGLFRIQQFDTWSIEMNNKFSDFLPADLIFNSDQEKEEVAKMIKEFYFHDKPVGPDTVLGYVDYFTDILMAYPSLRSIKLNIAGGNHEIYLYEYSFVDEDTPFVPHTKIRGANHCAQTQAVADGVIFLNPDERNASRELMEMKKIIREMWHNFITTGKPVPEGSALPSWPALGANQSLYMSLGQKVELRDDLLKDRIDFWSSIYDKYYREPVPPPPSS
nr:carboxylesterase 4 [Athetis lepigone]